jgi:HAD superfamily hydrolase (TIGR01509 family)
MPEIKAVVFDMDGLMFNTEDLYDIVLQSLLERRGKQFTNELKMKMMGLPGWKAFQVLKDDCQLSDSVEVLEHELHGQFYELLPAHIQMMPGLETLLARLEELKIPKSVATSSDRELANLALEMFDLPSRFKFILTSDDVTNGKPHPEVYEKSAEGLGVEPSEMLALEDSVIGSTAAAASGAYTIAIPGKHSMSGDFSHVDHVVDRIDNEKIMSLFRSL